MIGREPKNERQRRAEAKAREDLENPSSLNVGIIVLKEGSETMAAAEHLVLIDDIANLKQDMKRFEDKIDAPGEESMEKLLSEIESLKIRLFDIERRAINQ
jgi:hypothetical protein